MNIVKNFPNFKIDIDNIENQTKEILSTNKEAITKILQEEKPTYENTVKELEKLHTRFDNYWSVVSHLHSVMSEEPIREQYKKCIPLITTYYSELGQNKKLFKAFQKIYQQKSHLTQEQIKYLENEIRDFKLAGVDLSHQDKEKLTMINTRLSQESNKFQENVLDATQNWQLLIKNKNELTGLPDMALKEAEQFAKENNKEGFLFNLDFPSYIAIMRFADDRALREKFYYAFTTRASAEGPLAGKYDNTEIIHNILEFRQEIANLLGFKNYAEYSLSTKMVNSTKDVISFLDDLLEKSKNKAGDEIAQLRSYASEVDELMPWDVEYYREKYKKSHYKISEEELRQYFPVDKVITGLFEITQKLFGLNIKISKQDSWHEDVKVFEISDDKEVRGYIYADLFARKNKRGGAWMDELRVRHQVNQNEIICPMAFLTCNFSRPLKGETALLTHDEVITLFHEFGHCLHHVLTKVNVLGVSGINGVPWDAVELPSQFLENWCWSYDALKLCSGHVKDNKVLPHDLFDKLLATKNYHAALYMLRQLEFALFDFKLHMVANPTDRDFVQNILDEVRNQTNLLEVPKYNKFQNGFSHIFAGGYAAGYYSYKWAEVLACDAFDRFISDGIFNEELGTSFKENILEKGGSEDIGELFIRFRGREPKVDALLEQNGII